jgi:cytochrome P450
LEKCYNGENANGDQQSDPYFEAIKDATSGSMLAYNMPWAYHVVKYIPVAGIQKMFTAQRTLIEKGRLAIQNSSSSAETANIFASVMNASDDDKNALSDQDITVEAGSFMVAGTDTTSNTLT